MSVNESNVIADRLAAKSSIVPFAEFIGEVKAKMKNVFRINGDINQMSVNRGIRPGVLNEIMSANPLAVGVPVEYGGRGVLMHEGIALLEAASYESLALSLTFGINNALFLQPFGKYANEEVKANVFNGFLEKKHMGGLMITEPDFGSDALNMQTHYTEADGKYHLVGKKHWAGLTGMANYWLLTARQKTDSGNLQRDIDFFLCDVNSAGQGIVVEEYFENLGLYMIPYGRNNIDLKVPVLHRLNPHTSGVQMMLDLLHRSRMQFPGMGMGFIQRMLDEAILHCKQRFVGGKTLFSYDQVQERLARLQASYTICSAMCLNSGVKAGIEVDLAPHGLEANAVKSVVTDLMQEAAQSLLTLVGAKAFKLTHIGGRGTNDSRPFQIFEGSNDILYNQISEAVVKMMKRSKENNLYQFMKQFELTMLASDYLKNQVNFNIDLQMSQRKLVDMGRFFGRIIVLNQVIEMGNKGYRKDLIDSAIVYLQQEISGIIATFSSSNNEMVIEGYEENSAWINLLKK